MIQQQTDAEVVIERIAAGGDGVGHWPDGRVVFVPRAAPGDRVSVGLVLERRRYLRGEVRALLEPGPQRVAPLCAHYVDDHCGGCQLQHLSIEAQRTAKASIVGDALRRLAGLDLPDPPIEAADESWAYRRKVTVSRAALESFGFHRLQPAGALFALEDCRVAAHSLMKMWHAIAGHPELIPRVADRLTLREDSTGGLHLVVHGVASGGWPEASSCATTLDAAGVGASLWQSDGEGQTQWLAGRRPAIAALAFEQVNPPMGDRVRRDAVALLGDVAGRHVWDLYAGVGDTAVLLAEAGARVSCVESAADAVASSRERAGVRWFEGTAESVVRGLERADLVITNPPRGGMAKPVIEALLAVAPKRVVYVSCDPATMARDVKRLGGSFAVSAVRAYDLFPQTAHVEAVTLLERR